MEKTNLAFDDNENLYRAVLPGDTYWKADGSISSGVFKDAKGLSTDRALRRPLDACVNFLDSHLTKPSGIIAFTVNICLAKEIIPKHDPIESNVYHTLVLGSESRNVLSGSQAKFLAKNVQIIRSAVHLNS